MNSLPVISHRMFAAAAGQAPGPLRQPANAPWPLHTVAPPKVVHLEVAPPARAPRPVRQLKVWPGRSQD